MKNNMVDTSYSLRLVGVEEVAITAFKLRFPDIEFKFRKHPNNKENKFILVFELNDKLDFLMVKKFIKKYDTYEEFDIFASITSEIDNYIVEFPENVMNAIRELPVKVNISFIFIEP